MKLEPLDRLLSAVATRVDHLIGWHRLPWPPGIVTLIGIRNRLRRQNLYDTGVPDRDEAVPQRWLGARSDDGSCNDLESPAMGSFGARFGRNLPPPKTYPETEPAALTPSPRLVSTALLTRERFIPAPGANVLVAAWLQFEVHDWFSHGKNEPENPWRVPLATGDSWREDPMRIQRTRLDPSYRARDGGPPTYITDDSHWWDGSQIYGSTAEAVAARRGDDGTMRLDPDGLPPLDQTADLSGAAGNAWLGLGLLHTLFTREHNNIAAELRKRNRTRDEDWIFDKARLVNAALMAKIHTVEWTPTVISHPTTRRAMRINWWGLAGEKVARRRGRLGRSDLISGIPGSPVDHHGVPYALTEEFVAVYRMHPLLPDDYLLRSHLEDRPAEPFTFRDIGALQTRQRLQDLGIVDWFYSFGRANPGLVCLHNYPRFLQEFHRPNGEIIDLAAIDVLRVRERGVPRYNEFRRLMHLKPVRDFDELTANPIWAHQLKTVYGDIEAVDLMTGSYAERFPKGFAFSDTAFRIFVLMASRRLKSDRFFTDDYRPEIYTQEGLDWVSDNTLVSVIRRNFPQLGPALEGVENGFAMWNAVGG
jgi:hypothetical protein